MIAVVAFVFLIWIITCVQFARENDPKADEPLPACPTCGQKFLDVRGVDWHRRACHPPDLEPLTHDEGSISRWNR